MENEAIKRACTYVMDVLGRKSTEEPLWITRYQENIFGGGKKIYAIQEGKINVWGEWALPTATKEFMVAPDGERVWCYGENAEDNYAYVLPIKSNTVHTLGKMEIRLEEGSTSPELISWAKQQFRRRKEFTAEELDGTMELVANWYGECYLELQLISKETGEQQQLLYDTELQKLAPVTTEGQDFSIAQLAYDLSHIVPLKGHTYITQGELGIEGVRLYLGQDYITIYEYATIEERQENKENLQSAIGQASLSRFNREVHFWEKGKLIVTYEGVDADMMRYLTDEMK